MTRRHSARRQKNGVWVLCVRFFLLSCCVTGFSGYVYAVPDHAQAVGLVPHKALYDVRLSARGSSAKIADIRGKMFYEWHASCDAWISSHKFDMTYDYTEMPPIRVTSAFSTHESFDGQEFNYTSQRKKDGVLFEEVRGSAQAAGQGRTAQAVYTKPDNRVFDLPVGTLFPMAHTLDVLRMARDGKKFHRAVLFDGSDEKGPVEVSTFIGAPAAYAIPEAYQAHIDPDLVRSKAWNMRLAFFPLNEPEGVSDYEMSVIFHENGVITDMEIDYSDFSVTQTLMAIEPMENSCDMQEKKQ